MTDLRNEQELLEHLTEYSRKVIAVLLRERRSVLDNPEYGGTELDYFADEMAAQLLDERKKSNALIGAAVEACAKECDSLDKIAQALEDENCLTITKECGQRIRSLAPEAAREEIERIEADARLEGELIGLRFAVENDLICACDLETKPEDLCTTHKRIAELTAAAGK